MAQSSDSNDNNNDDIDATGAEQILGSIIDHIESADDSAKSETVVANAETDEQAKAPGQAGRAKADFQKIEKRASQLATMLGGAGLSYNTGAKLHLSDPIDEDEQREQEIVASAKASIHADDLDMEKEITGVSQAPVVVDERRLDPSLSEQEQHVNEWEADASDEQRQEAETVIVAGVDEAGNEAGNEAIGAEEIGSPVQPDNPIIENNVSESMAIDLHAREPQSAISDLSTDSRVSLDDEDQLVDEIVIGSEIDQASVEQSADKPHADTDENLAAVVEVEPHSPDLRNIEQQIEALSFSMQEQDVEPEMDPIVEEATVAVADGSATNDLDCRVASMEKQIVQLLDKVTRADQKLSDTVGDVMRGETQQAVEEALSRSDLIINLNSELENAGEERRLQDVRMSDSLDALHDAIKDIGERMHVVETTAETQRAVPDVNMALGGGIASSVLGTQLQDHALDEIVALDPLESLEAYDAEPAAQPAPESVSITEPEPESELSQEDELPTWLEDATQDLHREVSDASLEQADVFASSSSVGDNEDRQDVHPEPVEEPLEAAMQVAENLPVEENALDDEVDSPLFTSDTPSVEEEPIPDIVEPMIEADIADKDIEERHENAVADVEVEQKSQENERKESDFLHAARAAARAANVRARELELEARKPRKSAIAEKSSKFLAAAKQKEKPPEIVQPAAPQPKKADKNSLFSDRVEGPNSLLIFTSLILFGTSALLLYGMSKNTGEGGSVATLEAVEKETAAEKSKTLSRNGASANENPSAARQAVIVSKSQNKKNLKKIIRQKALQKKRTNDKRSQINGFEHVNDQEFKITSTGLAATGAGEDTLTDYDKMVSARMSDTLPAPSSIETTAALSDRKTGSKTPTLFDEYVSFSGLGSGRSRKTNIGAAGSGVTKGLLASASSGDVMAQYQLARRFGTGNGVSKNHAVSVEWYEKSARAGYAPAIYRLATMYERGNGVAKDYERAMKLYISAASKGNVKAMHNLAVLYTGGNLGKADYKKAINWYSKAAEFGVKDSQFNLGIIYQHGMGGARNLSKAYKWYTLAARSGDLEAKDLVVDLRAELSPKQLSQMDRDLRTWKASTPNRKTNAAEHFSRKKA